MIPVFAPRVVAFTICLFFTAIAAADSKLSKLLTEDEFTAAGLDKLSPEELQQLDQLWARYSGESEPIAPAAPPAPAATAIPQAPKAPAVPAAAEAPVVKPVDDLMGREQLPLDEKKLPKEIRSRIVGTFEGWSGDTKFKLENGQVWQQRIGDSVNYTAVENPEVTVYKALGGYRIRIEGYRQTCPVKRIQ